MGNKSSGSTRSPETENTQGEEVTPPTESGPHGNPPGPSPDLLASLQTLGEHSDHTLLPQSLHQIAEAYSLEEDYPWAVQFLQLERLYHERLLSNLAALQEDWENQCRERNRPESSSSSGTNNIGQEHIEILSQICRTHQRPTQASAVKSMTDAALKDIQNTRGQCDRSERERSLSHHGRVDINKPLQPCEENDEQHASPVGGANSTQHRDQEGEEEEEEEDREKQEEGEAQEEGEQEEVEEGQEVDEDEEEVFEETPEEEVKLEWPTGVPQASVKDLVKLSHVEAESSSPDGLVSILKRRRASLDGLPPSGPDAVKQNSKRKVRFSEPEDGLDQDDVGGDSCLILLLLCSVTVVISVGGTALYCALVDTYSSICTDFSHNVDFYVMNVRHFVDGLRHWLPLRP